MKKTIKTFLALAAFSSIASIGYSMKDKDYENYKTKLDSGEIVLIDCNELNHESDDDLCDLIKLITVGKHTTPIALINFNSFENNLCKTAEKSDNRMSIIDVNNRIDFIRLYTKSVIIHNSEDKSLDFSNFEGIIKEHAAELSKYLAQKQIKVESIALTPNYKNYHKLKKTLIKSFKGNDLKFFPELFTKCYDFYNILKKFTLAQLKKAYPSYEQQTFNNTPTTIVAPSDESNYDKALAFARHRHDVKKNITKICKSNGEKRILDLSNFYGGVDGEECKDEDMEDMLSDIYKFKKCADIEDPLLVIMPPREKDYKRVLKAAKKIFHNTNANFSRAEIVLPKDDKS